MSEGDNYVNTELYYEETFVKWALNSYFARRLDTLTIELFSGLHDQMVQYMRFKPPCSYTFLRMSKWVLSVMLKNMQLLHTSDKFKRLSRNSF